MANTAIVHGHKVGRKASPTYVTWNGMIARCERPSSVSFKNYGAKGITVCPQWHEFSCFLKDMGVRPEGTSLDRIDPTLGYQPGNCQWSTRLDQSRNREKTRRITFKARTLTIGEWAELCGIKRNTLAQRLYAYGWTVERALKEIANA